MSLKPVLSLTKTEKSSIIPKEKSYAFLSIETEEIIMGMIPQVKCRRCGATFSSMRSRCPNCGTRVVSQSSRSPGTTPGTIRGTAAHDRAETNTKWQMAFGLILVIAVILSVIVMVTASLEGIDNSNIKVTATPALISNLQPQIEAAPTAEPTPMPKVESIKILYMNTKDLTPENAWPTMHVGESININAVVYPMDIVNPVVEWSCSDKTGEYLSMTVNDDGTVDLLCNKSLPGGATVTATCNGTSQTIKIYLAE